MYNVGKGLENVREVKRKGKEKKSPNWGNHIGTKSERFLGMCERSI